MTYIELEDVLALVPLSRATLYRRVGEGSFPKPVKVERRVFWIREEIDAWKAERAEGRS